MIAPGLRSTARLVLPLGLFQGPRDPSVSLALARDVERRPVDVIDRRHIRSRIEQRKNQPDIVESCGTMKGRAAVQRDIHIGAPLDEEIRDVQRGGRTCQHQRRHA